MWQVPVTICLLGCFHFYHSETSVGVCGHWVQQSQIPVGSSFILLQHNEHAIALLFSSAPFPLGVYECVGEKCNWQFLVSGVL